MATEIGKLIARFEANVSHFEAGRKRVEQGMRQTATQMTATERAQVRASEQLQRQRSAALVRQWNADQRAHAAAERAKVRAAEQSARAQERAHDQMIARSKASYASLAAAASKAFLLIGGAAVTGLGLAISRAMSMDALVRGLTAIAGTSEKAQEQLKRLREVAKAPGLGFREAIQGSIRLQAVGINAETAERALKAFGNAVALTGGGKSELDRITVQLGQLSAKGKILAQDLKPIIEAAPAVGKALKEAFGTVDSEQLQALGLTTEQFIGKLLTALEKLPQVTNNSKNAWENFTDSLDIALVTLGKPFLEPLTRALDAVSPLLQSFAERTGEIFTMIGQDSVKLWENLPKSTKDSFASIVKTVQDLGGQVTGWFKENYPLIQAVVTNVLNKIAAFWQSHGGEIKAIVSATLKSVLDTATTILKILEGDWRGAWGRLASAVKEQGKVIQAAVVFVVRLAFEAVVAQKDLLKKGGISLGEALVDGAVQGMKSKAGWLTATVEALFNPLVPLARSILGSHSPSRKFFAIGQDVALGFALGIQSKSPEVQQTLADMLDIASGKFAKAPKKPAESAAKQIADMLKKQAEALRELAGEETAVARMNRLLSDPTVAKRIDDRTKALIRNTAAMIDASKIVRERYAITRPRRAEGETDRDAVRDRIVNPLAWMTGTRARRVGDNPDSDAVDFGGGSFWIEGGTGSERQRRKWGPSEEDFERLRSRTRRLADDITGAFNRAVVDGLEGGIGQGLKSMGLSLLDFVQNIFLSRLQNAIQQSLTGLAMGGGSGGGFWSGLLKSILGGAVGGAAGGITSLGGGSTYTPGGTGAVRPRIVGRATGGPIWPGQAFKLHRDELVVPTQAGMVYNRQQQAALGNVVHNHYTINMAPAPNASYSPRRSARQQADMLLAALQGAQA